MPTFELFIIARSGLIAWFWLDTPLRAREAGIRRRDSSATSETCNCSMIRSPPNPSAWRVTTRAGGAAGAVYGFEFSDNGNNRRHGSVTLLGKRVVMLDVRKRARASAMSLAPRSRRAGCLRPVCAGRRQANGLNHLAHLLFAGSDPSAPWRHPRRLLSRGVRLGAFCPQALPRCCPASRHRCFADSHPAFGKPRTRYARAQTLRWNNGRYVLRSSSPPIGRSGAGNLWIVLPRRHTDCWASVRTAS